MKAAGRTFSFASKGKSTPPPSNALDESPPATPDYATQMRPRAVTGSSYASTATPPKIDDQNLALSLGGDFGDMFSGFDKRKSAVLDAQESRSMSNSPVSYFKIIFPGFWQKSNLHSHLGLPADRAHCPSTLIRSVAAESAFTFEY